MSEHNVEAAEAKVVAETIIAQLGGYGRLKAMIALYDVLYDKSVGRGAVCFKFKGSRKWNYVKITLNGLDLYDVQFCKIGRGTNVKWREPINNVYNDMLKEIFENETGLYLSL